jgi:hypothetical protein
MGRKYTPTRKVKAGWTAPALCPHAKIGAIQDGINLRRGERTVRHLSAVTRADENGPTGVRREPRMTQSAQTSRERLSLKYETRSEATAWWASTLHCSDAPTGVGAISIALSIHAKRVGSHPINLST